MTDEINDLRKEVKAEIMQHKADQKEVVRGLTHNIERLTDAVVEIKQYQAELNTVSATVAELRQEVKDNRKEIADVRREISDNGKKLAVADAFINHANKLVWAVVTLVVVIVVKMGLDYTP